MNEQKSCGFLVVLKIPQYPEWMGPGLPENYRGVDRLTPMPIPGDPPEYPEEAEALEAALWGDYYPDEGVNLIPSYEKALDLYRLFARSPREYEIIFCCENPEDLAMLKELGLEAEVLGYDVSLITGDRSSIVLGMPESQWVEPFRRKLNRHWLFDTRKDAEEYLRKYREEKEHDWDMDFSVVLVARVIDKTNT